LGDLPRIGRFITYLPVTSSSLSVPDLAACGKTQKYVIPNHVRFLNGVRNLLFPWFAWEQQIPQPQTTRVRDDNPTFSAAC
jgi:hypothetical protein